MTTISTLEIKDERVVGENNIHSVETCIEMDTYDIYLTYSMKYRNLSIILKHDNTTHSSKPYGRGSHVCTINDLSNIYEIMDATDQVVASIGGENISSVILGEIMKIIKDYIPVKNTVRHMGPSKEEQRELDELKKIRDRYCRPDDYKPEDGIKTTKRAWLPRRTASLDNDYHLGV